MCLGIPGQIVSIDGHTAIVDFWGTRKPVRLDIDQPVQCGDYVINHAGFVVRVIPPHEVMDTLALYELILAECGDDPLAYDAVPDLEEAGELLLVPA